MGGAFEEGREPKPDEKELCQEEKSGSSSPGWVIAQIGGERGDETPQLGMKEEGLKVKSDRPSDH